MKKFLTGLLLLWSCLVFAQKFPVNPNKTDARGLRQGRWTILFNAYWKPVTDRTKVIYYRIITYKNDKPVGMFRDYFRSGKVQMEGFMLADRPKEIMDSTSTYYNEKGIKRLVEHFKNGQLVSTTKFDKTGKEIKFQWIKFSNQGDSLADIRNFKEAVESYEKARTLAIQETGTENADYTFLLSELAHAYYKTNAYEKAIVTYTEALHIREKIFGNVHKEVARAIMDIGYVYFKQGEYAKAEEYYLQGIQIREKATGKLQASYAIYLNFLAELYRYQGIYAKAEPLYQEALQILEKTVGKEDSDYGTVLSNLGVMYKETGNYAKAERLYLEDLQITAKNEGTESEGYSAILGNLAGLSRSRGQYARADSLYNRVLGITEKVLGKESMGYAVTLYKMAKTYTYTRQYAKAEQADLQALQVIEYAVGKQHPFYGDYQFHLATVYQQQANYNKAEPIFAASLENSYSFIEHNFPALSESEKEASYRNFQNGFEGFNAFCEKRYLKHPAITASMYNNQLATKALLLNSSLKLKQRIRNSSDTALLTRYAEWENLKTALNKLSDQQNPKKRKLADSLEKRSEALEKELSRKSEGFATLTDKKRFTWQDVQRTLKPHEAALEIIRYRKFGLWKTVTDSSDARLPRYPYFDLTDTVHYAVLLVKPHSKYPELVLLENGNQLENKGIHYYQNSIRSKTEDKLSYNRFWKPIARKLGKKTRKIYVSPDGVYNSLNLNTLFNPASGKYLSDEVQLNLLTNTKDLLAVHSQKAENNLAYLFGYPDYELGLKDRRTLVEKLRKTQDFQYSLAVRGESLISLPGTKAEVEQIASLMNQPENQAQGWQPKVEIGTDALEENVKNCNKPRLMHFATHGFFEADSLGKTNPLLLSGLMLTGAAQTLAGNKDNRTEDGILTAYEAMNLNLDNTDLVVLSACETGLGEIRNGEGVYGLQRAFKVAGAKTLIMSLWKVSDAATQELMGLFYENWLKTGNKRAAFDIAQQNLRQKYPQPYFWGAFVMVGE